MAGSLGYCDDLDPIGLHSIEDQICSDWPEENREGSQVFAPVSYAGGLSERLEGVEKFVDPAIRRVEVVLCDVLPNLVEIQLSVDT
jgi:hypothetical protein